MEDNTLPTVTELAKALKDRIYNHKGKYTAIWKQLDDRFKDLDAKSIDGVKISNRQKISFSSFKKACQRLGSKDGSETPERMTFGIRGNPVLLMNVFDILGIKGFSDLLKTEFKRPDITDELVYIDTAIDEVNRKIESLDEKLENVYPKSIKAIKLNADFEEILNRLFFAFTENKDPLMENQFYRWLKDDFTLIQAVQKIQDSMGNPRMFERNIKNYKMQEESNMFYRTIKNVLFDGVQPELKRVCLLLLLFDDNKEYTLHDKLLLKYLKDIGKINIQDDAFPSSNTYLLSPLYLLYFFLRIAYLFIKRTGNKSTKTDDETGRYVRIVFQSENIGKYLLEITRKMSDRIKTILAYLTTNDIFMIPQERYDDYKGIAIKIIQFYYNIFIKGKTTDNIDMLIKFKDFKTIKDISKLKYWYISGIYIISKENIDTIEKIMNDIDIIVRATGRDINGKYFSL